MYLQLVISDITKMCIRDRYDVMVQEFARVLEKKGFTHEDAENAAIIFAQNSLPGVYSVSYTHLDVYKRQPEEGVFFSGSTQ